MLKSIHIQGFKSIRDARVELGRVNVLIGANASGKSNLIAFLRLVADIVRERTTHHVALAGGAGTLLRHGPKHTRAVAGKLFLSSTMDVEYSFTLTTTEKDELVFSEESVEFAQELPHSRSRRTLKTKTSRKEGSVLLDHLHYSEVKLSAELLANMGVFQFQDSSTTALFRRQVYIGDASKLNRDGGNLAAVLHVFAKMNPAFYRRIVATVRQVFPQFDDFVLEPEALNQNSIRLNWRERGQDTLFGPHQLSDGTLRFIALATLLLQPEDELPKVIVIDEPELGLHPYAIGVLVSLIKAASRYCQVVIATQSVTLLDQFDASDMIVVERDPIHNATEFRRLNSDELAVWKDEYENPISLGELWERNIIGGGPH